MASNKGSFIGGLFIGTVVGGILGILFAPGEGTETRKKVREGTEEALGDVYNQVLTYSDNLKDQLQDMTNTMTDKVADYKNQIEAKIQEIQDEVDDEWDSISEELSALQNESAEAFDNATVGESVANAGKEKLDAVDILTDKAKDKAQDLDA